MNPSSNISRPCEDGAPPPPPSLPHPRRRLTHPEKLLPFKCSPATTMISKTTVVSITVITLFRKVQIGAPPPPPTHTHTPSPPRGEGRVSEEAERGGTMAVRRARRAPGGGETRTDESSPQSRGCAARPEPQFSGGQSEAMAVKPECRENRFARRSRAGGKKKSVLSS